MSIKINGITRESLLHTPDSIGHGTLLMASHADEFEPLRLNNFELVVTGLDNLVLPTPNGAIALPYDDTQNILRLSCKEASLPTFNQEVVRIKRGNDEIKYAGTVSWPGGSFTFREFIGANTRMILEAWRGQAYDKFTGKVGILSDYKKTAYIMEYTPDLQLVNSTKLEGLWISGLDLGTRGYESNGVAEIRASFEYDRAYTDYEAIQ